MTTEGRVRVVVRSRKVPVRTVAVNHPIYSSSGTSLGSQTTCGLVYETVLDPRHLRAIEEGRKLSCDLGLELEVVDVSKVNPVRRVLSRLTGGDGLGPSVILTPGVVLAASLKEAGGDSGGLLFD